MFCCAGCCGRFLRGNSQGGGTGVHALLFYFISHYGLAETCTQKPRSVRGAAEEITTPLTQTAVVQIKGEQHVLLALIAGEQERTWKRDGVHQLCGCY